MGGAVDIWLADTTAKAAYTWRDGETQMRKVAYAEFESAAGDVLRAIAVARTKQGAQFVRTETLDNKLCDIYQVSASGGGWAVGSAPTLLRLRS